MYTLKKIEVYASEIAEMLESPLLGTNCVVTGPSSLDAPKSASFCFSEGAGSADVTMRTDVTPLLILTDSAGEPTRDGISFIKVDSPKAAFIRIINELFLEMTIGGVSQTARVDPNARLDRDVSIGEFAVINGEVAIGKNTIVGNNVVINGPVVIGNNCTIRDNATIGGGAYDFIFEKDGKMLQVPHIGDISIGDGVWIGANSSIERGAFESTVIGNAVKIDDLVQIGAGCEIGGEAMIMAGCILSRKVRVGESAKIAPGCCIRENVIVGRGAFLGLGAVVVKNVDADSIWYGNPARARKAR